MPSQLFEEDFLEELIYFIEYVPYTMNSKPNSRGQYTFTIKLIYLSQVVLPYIVATLLCCHPTLLPPYIVATLLCCHPTLLPLYYVATLHCCHSTYNTVLPPYSPQQ